MTLPKKTPGRVLLDGQDHFGTGKRLAAKKLAIQASVASVVREFKANRMVDETELDFIISEMKDIQEAVVFWNNEQRRANGKPVRTP